MESIGAVLPLLYPGDGVAQKVAEDAQSAPIPELHKAMFRWAERFTRRSWQMTDSDLEDLRAQGLDDAEIVNWAQIACLQTWWVMSADGGGIPLEGDALTGPAIGLTREVYESAPEGLTAAGPDAAERSAQASARGVAWVGTDEAAERYRSAARQAEARYGFVPNLFKAVSLRPEIFPRHLLALELLDGPRSPGLSPRQHAMVRARVSSLNRSAYSAGTTRALLERVTGDDSIYARLISGGADLDLEPDDRAVLDFADKATRNAYKITAKDAAGFRDAGLGDEGYVDVLNTVSIQTSFDRLANSLGVVPDEEPLLPRA